MSEGEAVRIFFEHRELCTGARVRAHFQTSTMISWYCEGGFLIVETNFLNEGTAQPAKLRAAAEET